MTSIAAFGWSVLSWGESVIWILILFLAQFPRLLPPNGGFADDAGVDLQAQLNHGKEYTFAEPDRYEPSPL